MPKHSSHILELARRGADVRFQELLDDMKLLTLSFPHLRDAVDRDELPVNFLMRQGRDKASAMASTTRVRRKMSAAARRKISLAQKRRWAKQRKTKTS